jgi:hypothetical protein
MSQTKQIQIWHDLPRLLARKVRERLTRDDTVANVQTRSLQKRIRDFGLSQLFSFPTMAASASNPNSDMDLTPLAPFKDSISSIHFRPSGGFPVYLNASTWDGEVHPITHTFRMFMPLSSCFTHSTSILLISFFLFIHEINLHF